MKIHTSTRAALTFDTDKNKQRTVTISEPASDITVVEIEAACDELIAADIFDPTSERGSIDQLSRADIIKEFETTLIAN